MQILFPILLFFIGVTVVNAPEHTAPLIPELHMKAEAKEIEKELKHSEQIAILAECESRSDEHKGCIVDTNGELSCGMLQFQKETFWSANKKYKILPELTYEEIENVWSDADIQRQLTDNMLSEPEGWRNWTNCALKHNVDY